jgi:ParB-like chromosome segregation protein Spo0J
MAKTRRKAEKPSVEREHEGMTLRRVPVSMLNLAAYNPRKDLKPGDKAYEALKKSMERFGDVEPIVWNERSGHVVGGHQRLKIKISEFHAQAADVVVVNLADKEEKALNLALNKIKGDWDIKLLKTVLDDIASDEDFDFEVTGFDSAEMSELESMGAFLDDAADEAAEYEANPPKDAMIERKEIEKRKAIVKIPVFVEDLVKFERIMKLTGEINRSKAFMKVMEAFSEKVSGEEEGELKWD